MFIVNLIAGRQQVPSLSLRMTVPLMQEYLGDFQTFTSSNFQIVKSSNYSSSRLTVAISKAGTQKETYSQVLLKGLE